MCCWRDDHITTTIMAMEQQKQLAKGRMKPGALKMGLLVRRVDELDFKVRRRR